MHEEQAPLRNLVHKLLDVGRRTARLATAVVLQLSHLFLACPAVAMLYEEELLQLLLADSKDPSPSAEVNTPVIKVVTSVKTHCGKQHLHARSLMLISSTDIAKTTYSTTIPVQLVFNTEKCTLRQSSVVLLGSVPQHSGP